MTLLYATGTRVSRSSLSLADDFSWWAKRCGHRGPRAQARRYERSRLDTVRPRQVLAFLYSLSLAGAGALLSRAFNAASGKRPEPERSTTASAYPSPFLSLLLSLHLSRTVARVADRRTSRGTRREEDRSHAPTIPSTLLSALCCMHVAPFALLRVCMYVRTYIHVLHLYKPSYRTLNAWKIIQFAFE